MNKRMIFCLAGLSAFVMTAQTPAPGGPHRGFGSRSEFGMRGAGPMSRTPVTGAPYSAVQTMQSQETLTDGNQIVGQEQTKVYRDREGRVRTERTFTHGSASGETVVTIFDPVANSSYILNPSKSTAIKSALPPAHGGQSEWNGTPRQRQGNSQVQTENLGTQSVNGVAATGTRVTITIPANAIGNVQAIQIVRETWVSNDLKVPVMIKTTDPRFGTRVMQLTNIVQGDPDPSLFQVPSNYTVTTRGMGGRMGGPGAHMRRSPE